MGMLLLPVVMSGICMIICFRATCLLSGLVWKRCEHILPYPYASPIAAAVTQTVGLAHWVPKGLPSQPDSYFACSGKFSMQLSW